MGIFTILFIAVGLAMDAFAVAVSSGMAIEEPKAGNALKIGMFFGVFQAVMPVLGWLAGFGLKSFISGIDHWIAFGLLCAIGTKMIFEAFRAEAHETKFNPLDTRVLCVLSLATSIDAFAVGVSLSFMNTAIIFAAIIIGVVTFAISFAGVFIGDRMGHILGKRMEVIGGFILITIGIRVLIGHIM